MPGLKSWAVKIKRFPKWVLSKGDTIHSLLILLLNHMSTFWDIWTDTFQFTKEHNHTKNINIGLGFWPCLLYVFEVAESECGARFNPSHPREPQKPLISSIKRMYNFLWKTFFSKLGVSPHILHVFGVAESESVVKTTPSCQRSVITSKNSIIAALKLCNVITQG